MKMVCLILCLFGALNLSFSQKRYDVIIDEIMADPAPPVGLPNNEWIELKNVSGLPVNLEGWRIADALAESGPFLNFTLQPDSFVIVCSNNAMASMTVFGSAIPVSSFPSLDNDGDLLSLVSSNGSVIDAVAYSASWYQNELKKSGGWTLEMVDVQNPCTGGNNWKASVDPRGGTPGMKNSVDGINQDKAPPKLKYVYAIDSATLAAVFDESLDSLSAGTSGNYNIDKDESISSAVPVLPLLNNVQLNLNHPLMPNAVYTLVVNNVKDCGNNIIGPANTAKVGLPVEASTSDVVINEILFNPRPNGFDYVEFYNKSNKILDASRLFAANRSSTGNVSSIEKIYPTPFYIFPGDYFVITENVASLEMNYLVKNADVVIELSSLPSYPDDEGDVVLLNGQGEIVDEVKYSKDWQFKLIDNPEGVSLERIDPIASSQDEANWHSAASTAGYGTPGYQNSEYRQTQLTNATVDVSPKIFSPDNDGHDDVAQLQYKVTEPGYVANITIFDSQGKPVRYLVKNGTLGLTGKWNWDGLDENGNKLPIGTYIIYTGIFNLQGKENHFKNAIVLARKFN